MKKQQSQTDLKNKQDIWLTVTIHKLYNETEKLTVISIKQLIFSFKLNM